MVRCDYLSPLPTKGKEKRSIREFVTKLSPMSKTERPPLSSLACVTPDCDHYGKSGAGNLTVRKIYGKDQIRYLRCRCCGEEFSERKNTALWNSKIPEHRAIEVSRQLAEGTSLKGTARLTRTHRDTVRRLLRKVGHHAEQFHEQTAQQLDIDVLEMDERHGYVGSKAEQCWDAVAIDAASKFVVQVEVGPRDQALIERLMRHSANRLAHPQDLVLMTDGEACYRTLFPVIFGVPYLPPGQIQSVVHPSQNIGFPEPSPMSRSSNIGRAENSRLSRSAKLTAVGLASTKHWRRWATTSRIPPP